MREEEGDLVIHEGDLIFETLVKAVNKVDSSIAVHVSYVGYANGKFLEGRRQNG